MARTTIVARGDVIQVLAAPDVTDAYNSVVQDWSSSYVVAEGRASVQNYLANEDDVDRQTTIQGWRLISDDPALFNIILPTHRIAYNGQIFTVDSPAIMYRIFNRNHHTEVFLRRVDG